MEELTINYNQFEVENGGSRSCMASAMCFARLFLDGDVGTEDLERILQAGAALYNRWSTNNETANLQYWTSVTGTFPAFLRGVECTFETNGFFDGENSDVTSSFDTVLEKLSSSGSRCGGVLTCENSSYSLCYDGGSYYYLFDSHGLEGGGAYVRRSKDPSMLKFFILTELVYNKSSEFSCVLFGKEA